MSGDDCAGKIVALLMEGWIEMGPNDIRYLNIYVALLMEGWIEILESYVIRTRLALPSSWRVGLKFLSASASASSVGSLPSSWRVGLK